MFMLCAQGPALVATAAAHAAEAQAVASVTARPSPSESSVPAPAGEESTVDGGGGSGGGPTAFWTGAAVATIVGALIVAIAAHMRESKADEYKRQAEQRLEEYKLKEEQRQERYKVEDERRQQAYKLEDEQRRAAQAAADERRGERDAAAASVRERLDGMTVAALGFLTAVVASVGDDQSDKGVMAAQTLMTRWEELRGEIAGRDGDDNPLLRQNMKSVEDATKELLESAKQVLLSQEPLAAGALNSMQHACTSLSAEMKRMRASMATTREVD